MENLDRSRETPQDNDLGHHKNLKLDNSRNFRKFYLGTVGHEQITIVSSTSTCKLHASIRMQAMYIILCTYTCSTCTSIYIILLYYMVMH